MSSCHVTVKYLLSDVLLPLSVFNPGEQTFWGQREMSRLTGGERARQWLQLSLSLLYLSLCMYLLMEGGMCVKGIHSRVLSHWFHIPHSRIGKLCICTRIYMYLLDHCEKRLRETTAKQKSLACSFSVLRDQWHFDTDPDPDPDPWIRILDYWSGSGSGSGFGYRSSSFWQWFSRCQQKMNFLCLFLTVSTVHQSS